MSELSGGWFAATCVCRVCGYKEVCVFPELADEHALQCAKCRHMTSGVVEYQDQVDNPESLSYPKCRCSAIYRSNDSNLTESDFTKARKMVEALGLSWEGK